MDSALIWALSEFVWRDGKHTSKHQPVELGAAMVTLINHDPDNRFTIAVGRKSVELARATVWVGKISAFEMPFNVRHCRLQGFVAKPT
jgi:hypothetical protein